MEGGRRETTETESHMGLKVDSDRPSIHCLSRGGLYCEQATRTLFCLSYSPSILADVFNSASITLI